MMGGAKRRKWSETAKGVGSPPWKISFPGGVERHHNGC
jgi:hypothetical protein